MGMEGMKGRVTASDCSFHVIPSLGITMFAAEQGQVSGLKTELMRNADKAQSEASGLS